LGTVIYVGLGLFLFGGCGRPVVLGGKDCDEELEAASFSGFSSPFDFK